MTMVPEQAAPAQHARSKTNSAPKPPTKKAQLIKLLSRRSGADVPTLSDKLGWQHHTTRAALSGLRKSGVDLTKEPAAGAKPARYKIRPVSKSENAGASDGL